MKSKSKFKWIAKDTASVNLRISGGGINVITAKNFNDTFGELLYNNPKYSHMVELIGEGETSGEAETGNKKLKKKAAEFPLLKVTKGAKKKAGKGGDKNKDPKDLTDLASGDITSTSGEAETGESDVNGNESEQE